MLTRLEQN